MSPRLARAGSLALGLVLRLGLGLGLGLGAGCYDIPRPACGFVCGPGGACPDGYRCAEDLYCHRNGAPADLACAHPDAALPVDAALAGDAAVDAAAAGTVTAGSDSTSPTLPGTSPRTSW